jgi:glycosyltransferase involved in cell wall biosynthesis
MKELYKSICAVICTFNRYDLLPTAIDSLIAQKDIGSDFSILVVDNSPDKVIAEAFAKKYSKIENLRFIYESTPGLSNARNVAFKNSNADIISYLDDDAVASEYWAKNILNGFNAFDKIGILGGKILPIWEVPRPTWLSDKLTGYVSVVDWGGDLRIASKDEWFAGANISFLRTALLDLNGFDTSLGRNGSGSSLLSNEETVLTRRIHELGYLSCYAPMASVMHLVEKKRISQEWFRKRVVWQAISDFMSDSDKSNERLKILWDAALTNISSMPIEERSIRSLYISKNDAESFESQMSTLYNFTFVQLAGFISEES